MARSVCAVAADGILLGDICAYRICISLLGHRLMKCGVEYENLRRIRHDSHAALKAHKVCGSVERCKGIAEKELFDNIVGYEAALEEVWTAVDHAMTYCLDLAHVGDNTELGIGEISDNYLGRLGVVSHLDLFYVLFAVLALAVSDLTAVDTDALADALSFNGICRGVEQLIFQRRATCVYYKYVHYYSSGKITYLHILFHYNSHGRIFQYKSGIFQFYFINFLSGDTKMKAIFIISEFNLLHRGHLRLFSACRDMADGGAVVAVMSGSAVQRGELAAQDKYARAEAAVRCGCDLVLELPAPWSCSGAEFFAGAGVSVASDFAAACGADGVLCFGSESGDIGSLVELARLLDSPEYLDRLAAERAEKSDRTESDIRLRDRVLRELYGASLPDGANNILGVEYIRALRRIGGTLTPVTVRREGDETATRSRSALRSEDMRGLSELCPPEMTELLTDRPDTGRLYPLAFDRFSRDEPITDIDGLSADLYYRIRDKISVCRDTDELVAAVTTKKYTSARVRRVILHALLGARTDMLSAYPAFTVVLAAEERGKALLASARRSDTPFRVLSSTGGDADDVPGIQLQRRADALYSMAVGDAPISMRKRHPFII